MTEDMLGVPTIEEILERVWPIQTFVKPVYYDPPAGQNKRFVLTEIESAKIAAHIKEIPDIVADMEDDVRDSCRNVSDRKKHLQEFRQRLLNAAEHLMGEESFCVHEPVLMIAAMAIQKMGADQEQAERLFLSIDRELRTELIEKQQKRTKHARPAADGYWNDGDGKDYEMDYLEHLFDVASSYFSSGCYLSDQSRIGKIWQDRAIECLVALAVINHECFVGYARDDMFDCYDVPNQMPGARRMFINAYDEILLRSNRQISQKMTEGDLIGGWNILRCFLDMDIDIFVDYVDEAALQWRALRAIESRVEILRQYDPGACREVLEMLRAQSGKKTSDDLETKKAYKVLAKTAASWLKDLAKDDVISWIKPARPPERSDLLNSAALVVRGKTPVASFN